MNKKGKMIIVVYAVILVLLNVLFLGIPFTKYAASWVMYAFSTISLIVSCVITCWAFLKDNDLRSGIYGFPVFRVGYYYVGAQIGLGIIICACDALWEVPLWIAIVLSVVLLGAAMIGVVATEQTRETIIELEKKTVADTAKVTYFKLDMKNIVLSCNDPVLRKQLEKLSEKFQYSDPVSNENLKEIEDEISGELNLLAQMIGNSEAELISTKISQIENLLANRNQRCKALK